MWGWVGGWVNECVRGESGGAHIPPQVVWSKGLAHAFV